MALPASFSRLWSLGWGLNASALFLMCKPKTGRVRSKCNESRKRCEKWIKCRVYMPDYCFKMSYNVARQVTYLTHVIFLGMLYATIHSRWCRKGEKNYLLGSLLSSLFHCVNNFTIASPPSITSKLCHPVPFDAEPGMPAPMVWDEVFHSNLEVEGKDKNSRHAVGLLRCLAAARGISWHSQNECSVGPPAQCGKTMVLETRGPWEFEKTSFCLMHQIWESVTLEFYLWSPGFWR